MKSGGRSADSEQPKKDIQWSKSPTIGTEHCRKWSAPAHYLPINVRTVFSGNPFFPVQYKGTISFWIGKIDGSVFLLTCAIGTTTITKRGDRTK